MRFCFFGFLAHHCRCYILHSLNRTILLGLKSVGVGGTATSASTLRRARQAVKKTTTATTTTTRKRKRGEKMVSHAVQEYMAAHPGRDADACDAAFRPHQPGISREEATKRYDAWSDNYEDDLNEDRYKGPTCSSQAMAELFPTGRDTALILDVACGTGLVAGKLKKLGFTRFHGVDPSEKMLELARAKNLYEKFFLCYLDANPLPMEADTYDAAVMSGGIGANLVPVEGLRQMVRVVKPGGFVVIAARRKYEREGNEYRDVLEQEMAAMEGEGIWYLDSTTHVTEYSFDNEGIVWKFVKC